MSINMLSQHLKVDMTFSIELYSSPKFLLSQVKLPMTRYLPQVGEGQSGHPTLPASLSPNQLILSVLLFLVGCEPDDNTMEKVADF